MVLAVGPEGVGEEARAGGCGQDRFQGGRGLSGRERVRELEDTSPPLSAHSCNWQSCLKQGTGMEPPPLSPGSLQHPLGSSWFLGALMAKGIP